MAVGSSFESASGDGTFLEFLSSRISVMETTQLHKEQ
jgi:hypothetical protein